MKLFEYEGKALLAQVNVSVPKSLILKKANNETISICEVDDNLKLKKEGELQEGRFKQQIEDYFSFPVMVKAQLLAKGRKKQGAIRKCQSPQEVFSSVNDFFSQSFS